MIQLGAVNGFTPRYQIVEMEESDIGLLIDHNEDYEDSIEEVYGESFLHSVAWVSLPKDQRQLLGCLCALASLQHSGFIYRIDPLRN